MNSDEFLKKSVELALDAPTECETERQSWICRNLCEIALAARVVGTPAELIDATVARINLTEADPRFCTRLSSIRSLYGACPEFYPQGGGAAQTKTIEGRDLDAAHLIASLCDELKIVARAEPPPLAVSALSGNGRRAETARREWRVGRKFDEPSFIERPDIPPDIVWRAWMMLPGYGPTMIVVDERLDADKMDVWWGVHNGTHLDHLAFFPRDLPAPIEFGRGLLLAESLAMCAEMRAGLEAYANKAIQVTRVVREGLVERLSRLRLPGSTASHSIVEARSMRNDEFNVLPTLSSAYITGAVALIGQDFDHPLIPTRLADGLNEAWRRLAGNCEVASKLRLDARRLS